MSECAELRVAIARLEAKIDSLGKVDEQSIIDKAVQQAGQLFNPKFAAIGFVASGAALKAAEAMAKASGLGASVAGLAARLAPIAGALAALGASAGTIKLLEARSDGLENYIDTVSGDLSKLYSQVFGLTQGLQQVRGTANNALIKADRALGKFPSLESAISRLNGTIEHVRGTANDALIIARRAIAKFPPIESTIEHIRGTANDGLIVARRAEARIESVASQFNARLNEFDQGVRLLHGDFVNRLRIAVIFFTESINGIQGSVYKTLDIHSREIYRFNSRIASLDSRIGYITNSYVPTYVRTAIANAAPNLRGLRGEKGLQGERGLPGVQGARGLQGQSGANGLRGLQGERGLQGDRGATGLRGERGLQGDRGATGLRGERGLQGERGEGANPALLTSLATLIYQTIARVTSTENRITQQEVVNQQGIAKLDQIIRQTSSPAIANAAKTGVCEATQPNQCLGNPLRILNELLQEILYTALPTLFGNVDTQLGQIEESIDDFSNNGGGTGGNNEPIEVNLDEVIAKLNKLSEVIGVDEYPASLPSTLIDTDKPAPANVSIANLTQFIGWFFQRFDEVAGQWEIPIEIKDSDPTTPGDQPQSIKLPNLAEAVAEMFTLIFQSYTNSEILLNIATRNLIESGMDKQQNFVTYKLLQSLTDWAGFKQKDIKLELPLTFTLNKTRYDEILQESRVNVQCVEFDDKFGLEADLMRFREASGILQAVYKRKLNPNGDIKGQILNYLVNTYRGVNKVNDNGNFDEFLNQVENGFTDIPSVGDPTQPYGRPYEQRPKIRNLTPLDPSS